MWVGWTIVAASIALVIVLYRRGMALLWALVFAWTFGFCTLLLAAAFMVAIGTD